MKYRQQALFIVLALSLLSLFLSRVGLSLCLVAFMVLSCVHPQWKEQLRTWLRTPFLLGISTLFFIPLISGLWSENLTEWLTDLRVKLPLLLYPIGFAGNWQLKPQQWRALAFSFLLLLFFAVVWSFVGYLPHAAAHNAAVLRSTLFTTPLSNDHVRFSWMVSAGVLLLFLLWGQENRQARTWLFLLGTILVIYLHVLAARAGLLSFYLLLLALTLRYLFQRRSFLVSAGIGLFILALPIIAWFTLPSFQNRIKYMRYDFSYIRNGSYLPGSNDGNRLLSLKAGWSVLKAHPFGVGNGDFETAAHQWYDQNVPGMLPSDKMFPSNEWLVYGGTAGWLGVLLFTAVLLMPFFMKTKHRFYWFVLNLMLFLPFLFDVGLEVQYGVFLYAFILLWWWKWLPDYGNETGSPSPYRYEEEARLFIQTR